MSTTIMAACWPLMMSPAQKAVLISLADNANDQGECWPSLPTIAKRTCLNRATVIRAIDALEKAGHLVADRSNGRHSRYTVTPNLDLFATNPSHSATGSRAQPVAQRNQSQSATRSTVQKNAPNPSHSATGPVAQCDSNRQEPSLRAKATAKGARANRAAPVVVPDWLSADVWRDWDLYRRQRKGWTPKARELSLRTLAQLREHGHDPTAVIEQSIERGWTGLFAVKPIDGDSRGNRSPSRIPSLADRAVEDWRERGVGAQAADAGRPSGGPPVGTDDRQIRPSLDVAVR